MKLHAGVCQDFIIFHMHICFLLIVFLETQTTATTKATPLALSAWSAAGFPWGNSSSSSSSRSRCSSVCCYFQHFEGWRQHSYFLLLWLWFLQSYIWLVSSFALILTQNPLGVCTPNCLKIDFCVCLLFQYLHWSGVPDTAVTLLILNIGFWGEAFAIENPEGGWWKRREVL